MFAFSFFHLLGIGSAYPATIMAAAIGDCRRGLRRYYRTVATGSHQQRQIFVLPEGNRPGRPLPPAFCPAAIAKTLMLMSNFGKFSEGSLLLVIYFH